MSQKKVLAFDLSTEGLNPLKHRIIGITVKTAKEELIISYRNEKEMLQHFWAYIKQGDYDVLTGFNSLALDVPMLITRSIKHRVKLASNFLEKHIDIRKVIIGKSNIKSGKLDEFRELLDIKFPESHYQKMHMSLYWESMDIAGLNEFLLRDVVITWKLYEHMQGANLL